MKFLKPGLSLTFLFPFVVVGVLSSYSSESQATGAFARATGSKCDKCHTLSFPRLTARGERFMRNGFQIKKENEGGFGLDDDEADGDDKLLRKIAETLSVTGDFEILKMKEGITTPQLGVPKAVGFLATGGLAKDTPVWVGADISADGAEVHRYTVGRTNVLGMTYINLRAGTLDPTTWTSFYGHSGALDTPSGDIGAYGGGHHGGGANFAQIGPGYGQRNGVEYYGYNDWLLLSAGLANGDSAADDHADAGDHGHAAGDNYDRLDYWVTGRLDFWKGSSASVLWYNANGAIEQQALTAALNIRFKNLDFRTQFTKDITRYGNSDLDPIYGLTMQADYKIHDMLMGIYRYDTTDNGGTSGVESQATIALVMKPQQNIKLTASYIFELDVAAAPDTHADGDDAHAHDEATGLGNHTTLSMRYMF